MFRSRQRRRQVPRLNTTSTADISFILLAFFLVTTSLDTERGLRQTLPANDNAELTDIAKVKERNVMRIAIVEDGQIDCGGRLMGQAQLKEEIEAFVENKDNSPTLPEKTLIDIPPLGRRPVAAQHLLLVSASRNATYDSYFQTQNTIAAAYNELRDRAARQHFGRPMKACTAKQREAIRKLYPQRIAEGEGEAASNK